MMNRHTFNTVALGVGLACAALLVWLWRGQIDRDDGRQSTPSNAPPAAAVAPALPAMHPPAATTAALSAEARALLAALHDVFSREDVRRREAVLSFKDAAAFRNFLSRAHAAGLAVLGRLDGLHTVRVGFENADALRRELANNAGDYAAVSANYLLSVPHPPARQDRTAIDHVPFRNRALAFLGVEENSNWGRGVTIAILDTGVAPDPTFDSRLRALDIGLGNPPRGGNATENGHGTAIAALAAGSAADAAGVAPGANLLSIRVTDDTGMSDLFTVSQAIVAAVDAGAKIINVSLGGYGTGAVLDAALNYATERGSVVVAAAGNDQAAQLAWPAAHPQVVSVGAIDAAEQQVIFSNSGEQLQLSAPGYGVQTAWLDGQRVYIDGTSASAPLVAGAIAAVLSQHPILTPQQAAQVLVQTASDGGPPGADPAFGHGILNLGWAMNRNDPGYIDTAVAAHFYDAANNQMQVVVQNRSGRVVTGMTLNTNISGMDMAWPVPPLSPGEIFVGKAPADAVALETSGSITFVTELTNPPGITDRNPANNRRSSVLTWPGPP